jgi:hypothetical protein
MKPFRLDLCDLCESVANPLESRQTKVYRTLRCEQLFSG